MDLRYGTEVVADVRAAYDWYSERQEGLGERFLLEFTNTIHRITDFPLSSAVIESPIRRAALEHFPYGILYSVENDSIMIYAVMHLRQDLRQFIERRQE